MDIKTSFADPKNEVQGVWMDYRDGSRVKLARLGNPAFQKLFDKMRRPYLDMIRRDKMPPERETHILCQCYARTLLLDWEGFEDGGKPLPYSEDAAERLLVAHMDFRNDVTRLAAEEEFFKRQTVEDSEKNSSKRSAGNSNTGSGASGSKPA
jgi:hypothetical protein